MKEDFALTDKSKIKEVAFYALKWLPAVAVMVTIFCLSHQPAADSAETSTGLLDILEKLFHLKLDHGIIREIAHGIEYFVLSLCVGAGFYFTCGDPEYGFTALMCILFGFFDEIHQLYIPGRAFELFDVGVDTLGIICGILVWLLINRLIKKHKKTA